MVNSEKLKKFLAKQIEESEAVIKKNKEKIK